MSKLNIAVFGLDEFGGFQIAIYNALSAGSHHNVVPVGPNDSISSKIDLAIMAGPFGSLSPLIVKLKKIAWDRPLIFWYSEPLPPPSWPSRWIYFLAKLRLRFETRTEGQAIYTPRILNRSLLGGGRLRAICEMKWLEDLGWLRLLAVFTKRHQILFGGWGLPTTTIPMGYDSSFGSDMGLRRDIDVVFLGSIQDRRRRRIVPQMITAMKNRGIKVVIKDGSSEHGYVFGSERAKLLNRTKILINIMRQPWDDLIYRALLTAPNGAMILSEPVLDSGPFVAGEHFAISNPTEMTEAVGYYLNNYPERRRITTAAYNLITTDLTMRKMAEKLINTWQEYSGILGNNV